MINGQSIYVEFYIKAIPREIDGLVTENDNEIVESRHNSKDEKLIIIFCQIERYMNYDEQIGAQHQEKHFYCVNNH